MKRLEMEMDILLRILHIWLFWTRVLARTRIHGSHTLKNIPRYPLITNCLADDISKPNDELTRLYQVRG